MYRYKTEMLVWIALPNRGCDSAEIASLLPIVRANEVKRAYTVGWIKM